MPDTLTHTIKCYIGHAFYDEHSKKWLGRVAIVEPVTYEHEDPAQLEGEMLAALKEYRRGCREWDHKPEVSIDA